MIFRNLALQSVGLGLASPIPLNTRDGMAFQEFTLTARRQPDVFFGISLRKPRMARLFIWQPLVSGEEAFQQHLSVLATLALSQCQYDGRWREVVHRSALDT